MRVVSARHLAGEPTDQRHGVDRHRLVEGVVAALLLALVAGSLTAFAPGVRLFAQLLVVVVAATVTLSLGRWPGLGAALAGTFGAAAGALLVAAPATPVLVEGVLSLLAAVVVVVLVASARSEGEQAVARARALDDAVAAFAATSGTGTLADAVAAGVRRVVSSASLVRLQLGPFHGTVEDLPDMVLAALTRTGERASLPDGFTRAADAVLVGLPVAHADADAGGAVVRVPAGLADEELERVAAFLARVAPTLAAHAAAALWADVDPAPAARDRDRDEARAHAAHDLRVPLTSLAGIAETLATHGESLESHKRRELYQVLTRSTRRVAHWVTVMLEDSLSGGEVAAVPHEVELGPLLEEAAQAASAATAGLDVRIEAGGEVVRADPGLVVRVLSNLLANAGHHAGEGGRVEVTVHDRGDEVQVRVADHGPGFDPEVLGSLPGREKRWLGGASGAGLGLGLASARTLVAAWGGSFGLGRTPGGGATVWFTLPLAAPDHEAVSTRATGAGHQADRVPAGREGHQRREHEPGRDAVRWTVVAADPASIPGHLRRR